jgi:hypothetical protein
MWSRGRIRVEVKQQEMTGKFTQVVLVIHSNMLVVHPFVGSSHTVAVTIPHFATAFPFNTG